MRRGSIPKKVAKPHLEIGTFGGQQTPVEDPRYSLQSLQTAPFIWAIELAG